MKRIVTIDTVTGRVLAQWSGGEEQTLIAQPGQTLITLEPGDTTDYSNHTWDGTKFVKNPVPGIRTIRPVDFVRRFTMPEEVAIDVLCDTNRTLSAWRRRIAVASSVNLDSQDVIDGLAYLKSVGVPTVWATLAEADRRIAEIRA